MKRITPSTWFVIALAVAGNVWVWTTASTPLSYWSAGVSLMCAIALPPLDIGLSYLREIETELKQLAKNLGVSI